MDERVCRFGEGIADIISESGIALERPDTASSHTPHSPPPVQPSPDAPLPPAQGRINLTPPTPQALGQREEGRIRKGDRNRCQRGLRVRPKCAKSDKYSPICRWAGRVRGWDSRASRLWSNNTGNRVSPHDSPKKPGFLPLQKNTRLLSSGLKIEICRHIPRRLCYTFSRKPLTHWSCRRRDAGRDAQAQLLARFEEKRKLHSVGDKPA
jgi:hypothetical protein